MTAADDPRKPDPNPGDPARAGAGSTGGGGSGTAVRPPVLRFTDSMTRALDDLTATPAWAMTPAEQGEALLALTRAENRLAELRLRVLTAADRNEVGTETGATSTAAWLAHQTASTTQSVLADAHLAQALDTDFEATRTALAAGVIDVVKARVIVRAVQALTGEHDDLPAGTHGRAEQHLVDLAQSFDVPSLRRFGKRLFEVVCPEAADAEEGRRLADEEARARRVAHLSMRDNGDGTVDGRFRLPTLHAALLRKALDALTSPRRLGEGRIDPYTGRKLPQATLHGRGFMELLENHLNLDTLPTQHGSPFTLVITIALKDLLDGLGVATLETGDRISAGEARRLCCKAGIIPMVLDGDSMPIDVGRKKRCYDAYQKLVIDHRHRAQNGCATANCDRPPAYCEYHHPHPWALGGSTDARTGIPLCPPHHHMADHPETWDMHRHTDGSVRFTRRQ